MTDTISKLSADPAIIANDGSESSIISATVLTDGAPAAAGVTVNWTSKGGSLSDVSSDTDAKGIAVINISAIKGDVSITVTAATADDSKNVTLTTYQPLAAPIVVNASSDDGYTLDYYDIEFGVQAEIPLYSGIEEGQMVTFYWGDVDNTSFIITESEHPPFIIDVSHEMSPDCLKDGTYNVYYIVADQAGNTTQSSSLVITVTNSGSTVPTLPAPTVAEADPYINIKDASDGVDAVVAYPAMVAGDVVTFYWTGYDQSQRQISGAESTAEYTIVDGDTSVTFTVEMASFYPNGKGYEGYAETYYTVTTAGQSALKLSDTTECLVDTLAP